MRRLPALAALVLAVGLLTPGVSAQAQTMGDPDPAPPSRVRPTPHVRPAPPYLPDTTRPVPIPLARPHGAPPVPIPHARLRGPGPVPMPHAGEPWTPGLRLPTR